MEELLEACRRFGLARGEFEGERYARLPHLKARIAAGQLTPDLRWVSSVPAAAPRAAVAPS